MQLRTIAVAFSVLSSGVAAHAGYADPFSEHAFGALNAQPIECPEQVDATLEDGQVADCATLNASFAEFKRSWGAFLKDDEQYQLAVLGGWTGSGSVWRRRAYRMGGREVHVAFSQSNRGLILTYSRPLAMCDPESDEELALPYGGTAGVSMPERMRSDTKRREILLGGGAVPPAGEAQAVLKLRISEHGVPEVLCVLDVHPPDQGYDVAAKERIRRWRYRAARRDGEPVAAAMIVTLTW